MSDTSTKPERSTTTKISARKINPATAILKIFLYKTRLLSRCAHHEKMIVKKIPKITLSISALLTVRIAAITDNKTEAYKNHFPNPKDFLVLSIVSEITKGRVNIIEMI